MEHMPCTLRAMAHFFPLLNVVKARSCAFWQRVGHAEVKKCRHLTAHAGIEHTQEWYNIYTYIYNVYKNLSRSLSLSVCRLSPPYIRIYLQHFISEVTWANVALCWAMVRERVPKRAKVPIHDIAKEWDSHEPIREYLRDDPKAVLFEEHINISIKHAGLPHINSLMSSLLLRVAGVDGHPQPPVRPLRHQINLLYQKAGRTIIEEKTLIDDSWHIRKFFSLVKMKTRKKLVSTAPHLNDKSFKKQRHFFEDRP